ncbi:MAG: LamG domain-containing protein [Euryarchaeota archaeon]|jgi:hypothetical protein|nr:LamG domain-containing protein [Euryarchaeota archaeon]
MGAYGGPDIITDGLIFAIDAGSERSYPGSGTTATDLAGTNTVALVNGVSYNPNQGGKWGFDGIDDQIILNSGTALVVNDFTITQWIQFPASTSRMSIGGGDYQGGSSYKGYIWYRSTQGEIRVTMDNETGAVFNVASSVYCNKWSQITATRSGSAYKLYIDGIQVNVTRTGSTNDFSIRTIGWSYSDSYAFSGNISNTLIYNTVLTDAEVLQNYNAQKNRFI